MSASPPASGLIRARALRFVSDVKDGGVRRFARFVVVGGLNTGFGYACYALLLWLGVPLELSLLGATVLGLFFNFLTTGRLVFADARGSLLPRFIAAYLIAWAIGSFAARALSAARPASWFVPLSPTALARSLTERAQFWNDFLAGFLLLPLSATLTYLLLAGLVYRTAGRRREPDAGANPR